MSLDDAARLTVANVRRLSELARRSAGSEVKQQATLDAMIYGTGWSRTYHFAPRILDPREMCALAYASIARPNIPPLNEDK